VLPRSVPRSVLAGRAPLLPLEPPMGGVPWGLPLELLDGRAPFPLSKSPKGNGNGNGERGLGRGPPPEEERSTLLVLVSRTPFVVSRCGDGCGDGAYSAAVLCRQWEHWAGHGVGGRALHSVPRRQWAVGTGHAMAWEGGHCVHPGHGMAWEGGHWAGHGVGGRALCTHWARHGVGGRALGTAWRGREGTVYTLVTAWRGREGTGHGMAWEGGHCVHPGHGASSSDNAAPPSNTPGT
jgi:hypothetical protein